MEIENAEENAAAMEIENAEEIQTNAALPIPWYVCITFLYASVPFFTYGL